MDLLPVILLILFFSLAMHSLSSTFSSIKYKEKTEKRKISSSRVYYQLL